MSLPSSKTAQHSQHSAKSPFNTYACMYSTSPDHVWHSFITHSISLIHYHKNAMAEILIWQSVTITIICVITNPRHHKVTWMHVLQNTFKGATCCWTFFLNFLSIFVSGVISIEAWSHIHRVHWLFFLFFWQQINTESAGYWHASCMCSDW